MATYPDGAAEAALDTHDVHLEPYAQGDADAVLRLAQYALARPDEHPGMPLWFERRDLDRELARWPVAPEKTMMVARDAAGEVVGFAGVECYPDEAHGLLQGPIVAPESRGQGFGHALFGAALEEARRQGLRRLWAAAGRENVRAERVLRAAGFTRGEVNAILRLESSHARADAGRRVSVHLLDGGDRDLALRLAEDCDDTRLAGPAAVSAAFSDVDARVYLADVEGEAMGLVTLDVGDSWIYGVGLRPEARGRGYAAEMVAAVAEDHWQVSDDPIGLTVRIDNLAGINLLRRQGFEPWLVLATYSADLSPR
jgi:ribosomal protein S18 acetylase RimI-like enzyme